MPVNPRDLVRAHPELTTPFSVRKTREAISSADARIIVAAIIAATAHDTYELEEDPYQTQVLPAQDKC